MATAVRLASVEQQAKTTTGSDWRWLFWLGGAASIFTLLIIPGQLAIFIAAPQPQSVLEWFELFQQSPLIGLLSFELLFILNAIIGLATTLALYVTLREVNPSWMALALVFSLVGSIALIVGRPAFDMWYLSGQYAAATTEIQRMALLAAGEALRAQFYGTAFTISYNLANIVLVIVPIVMLQSGRFSKVMAWAGILAGVIGWGLYIPEIGLYISIFSVLFLAVYQLLLAITLIRLARSVNA